MSEPTQVEMRVHRQGDLNMRLVINHAHGHMRIMDYRVGNYPVKRGVLDEIARENGLRKVFTLVEKQDSHNWRSVGFFREGIYPGFFRTADAYAMSRLYDDGVPVENVSATPHRPAPEEPTSFPGRKLRKPDGLRFEMLKDERSRRAVLSGFNGELRGIPFGRAEAPDLVLKASARKKEGWALAEIDDSFGHATVGFAPSPTKEDQLVLTAYAGNKLLTELESERINNLFGLSPATDRWANELYAGLGFKVTGRLAEHLKTRAGVATALIWHRRLNALA